MLFKSSSDMDARKIGSLIQWPPLSQGAQIMPGQACLRDVFSYNVSYADNRFLAETFARLGRRVPKIPSFWKVQIRNLTKLRSSIQPALMVCLLRDKRIVALNLNDRGGIYPVGRSVCPNFQVRASFGILNSYVRNTNNKYSRRAERLCITGIAQPAGPM